MAYAIQNLYVSTHIYYKEKNTWNDLMGDNFSSASAWDVLQFIPLDVCAASSISNAANKSKTAKDMIVLYDNKTKWEKTV